MTFAAFALIAAHLFALTLSYQTMRVKIDQGEVPSTSNLITVLVSFLLSAGCILIYLNQPTGLPYLLAAEFAVALLASFYFEVHSWLLCRKFRSGNFTVREREVLCQSAVNPNYSPKLLSDLQQAHLGRIAVHQAVALTEFEIAQLERMQARELPSSVSSVLQQLREQLAQLRETSNHCEQNYARLKGDVQLISQH